MAQVLSRDGKRKVVLTGCDGSPSENRKTGPMGQLWVLPNGNPLDACRTGADKAVCGDCPLRPKASGGSGVCYVVVAQGPLQIHKSTKGKRAKGVPAEVDRPVRFGAYGDPAFVPLSILHKLSRKTGGRYTGYTHQWETCDPRYARYCMASVDAQMAKRAGISLEALRQRAKGKGYRTFTVRGEGEGPGASEIRCPAESRGVQCIDCLLCKGNQSQAKDLCITVHGTAKGQY